jgi:FkbM family methyltransferase
VVDVGANIGLYTIEAAKIVGTTGQVVAIEASPAHYKTLTGNVGLNGFRNVTTVSSAAGDSENLAKLTLPDGANRGMFTLGAVAGCSSAMVKVRRIDDILEEQRIKAVDFIKIDIEGSELSALKGATETLKRSHPTILIELNEAALRGCGTTSNEVKSFLASLKYKGFIVGQNGLSPLSPD